MAGLLGDFGAAACPRPMGGSPPAAGAGAGRQPRYRQQAAPAATVPQRRARTDSRAVLRSPGGRGPETRIIKDAGRCGTEQRTKNAYSMASARI
jgi:hypothetical protein